MAIVVEELVVRLSADLKRYDTELARLQGDTDRRLAAIERRYQGFTNNLNNSVSRFASQAQTALAGVGVSLGVAELVTYADAWTRVSRSLESTAKVFGVVTISAQELAAVAIETRSDLEALSVLYNRTAVAAGRLGLDTTAVTEVTTTFAKALKLGQASAQEQSSAMLQFSQALQKGKLDGDEFRNVMETAGVVQQALSERFKVSTGTLFKMAEAGKLTAKDIIAALQSIKGKVDDAFDGAPVTVAEAFTNLKTAIVQYIGTANEAAGATNSLAKGIQSIAVNIDTIARFAAAMALALGLVAAPAIIASVGSLVGGMAALSVTARGVAAILAGASAGALAFADTAKSAANGATNLRDRVQALGEALATGSQQLAASAAEQVTAFLQAASAAFSSVTAGSGESSSAIKAAFGAAADAAKAAVNGLVGAVLAGNEIMFAAFTGLFGAIPEMAGRAMQAALDQVAGFVRNVAAALNNLPGIKIDIEALPKLQLNNDFAGTAELAQDAWARATKSMTRDYVAEWTAAAQEAGKAVNARADEISELRREALQGEEALRRANRVEQSKNKPKVYADPADENKYTKEIANIKKRTEALLAEISAVGKSTAAQEKAKTVQELLTKAREAEIAITPKLKADIDQLADAYGNAAAKLELLRTIQQVKDDSLALEREIELTGQYGFELQKLRTEAELLAAAKRAGVSLTAEETAEISRTAARSAALKELNESIESLRSTSQSALKSFISDLREGKSGAEALGGSLNKIADKLVDMAANQLVEAALGGLLASTGSGTGGGAGLVGKIFGFADGGVMVPGSGPRDLPKFAGGGVSNRAAIFGEAGPEAAVPLPDGRRIPVDLRLPAQPTNVSVAGGAGAVSVTVAPVINLSGSVSASDLANVRAEVLSVIPGAVQQGVSTAFDRNPRFRRSGL